MKKFVKNISLAAAMLVTFNANSALLHFEGNIEYHNDVILTYFTIENDATDVRLWTDSFMDGINFDPITALWQADGTLINEDDDNDSINPETQTTFDSGFTLDFLAAGEYIFSVATYNNFASGNNLSNGFDFDGESPIALSEWTQPANSTGMGSYWSVWLDGVDSASNPSDPTEVPEPLSLLLFAAGLLGLRACRK
ncbi:DVUA0089 family protein [Lacimicrobium alkaliphilum]|uniref:PEP-CTERM domain protein n=1 Tax=Lacimicrobium alkaliphilum TaxID=1526571 RepID=A0ABQ1RIK6_9ALTE|nr:DVUA0089 family protein [Lacimicrobium alkaliphilum]GGD67582.1 PEP-CTERM domain protein [Lacimicrobium alkaliphilum]